MNTTQNKNNKQLSRKEMRRRDHNYKRAEKRRDMRRAERRREIKQIRFDPILGQPGARDDPNRIGLSGCGVKWYLRFLQLGLEPDEARAKALDPSRRETRNQLSPGLGKSAGSRCISPRRDSSDAQTQDFDNKEDTMVDRIGRNRIGLTGLERKLYMRYIGLHFDPEEARGKVLHHRLVQGHPQPIDIPAGNEQSDKNLEIYCQKHGLTEAERIRFMQSMQKSNQLNYASNIGNTSFRSCIKSNSMERDHHNFSTSSIATNEATDEDETVPNLENPESLFCKENKIQGAGRKWFKRFLRQGYDLEGAHKKLLERRTLQKRQALSPEEQRKIYVWRKDSRPTTSTAAVNANKTKTPLLNNPDDHNRITQMAIVPKEYPKQTLREEELPSLEDAVIQEVAHGWEVNLKFKGINFGQGMLLVDCENVETANWLVQVAPQLNAWRGVALKACPRDILPNPHTVSIYLPNSAGQDIKSTLALIQSYNDRLNTSAWKVVSFRQHGRDQTLIIGIDQRSWETISSNQNVIRFGLGIVRVQKKY